LVKEVYVMDIYSRVVEKGLPGRFDYLDHMSDVFVVSYGKDIVELFENAGVALFHTMVDINSVETILEKNVVAEGFDLENTLYKWLEELLILYYSEKMICREINIEEIVVKKINDELKYLVRGLCRGEIFDQNKHIGKLEVKSPTYSLMRILKNSNGWKAYFVLDI